jgi:hypothetical protein
MPMASKGLKGTNAQEALIGFLSVSLAIAFLAVCCLVIWGLRGDDTSTDTRSA